MFSIGNRVYHVDEPGVVGKIIHVDTVGREYTVEYDDGDIYELPWDETILYTPPSTTPQPPVTNPHPSGNAVLSIGGFARINNASYRQNEHVVIVSAGPRWVVVANESGEKFKVAKTELAATSDKFDIKSVIGMGSIVKVTRGKNAGDRLWCVINRTGDNVKIIPVNFDVTFQYKYYRLNVKDVELVRVAGRKS